MGNKKEIIDNMIKIKQINQNKIIMLSKLKIDFKQIYYILYKFTKIIKKQLKSLFK